MEYKNRTRRAGLCAALLLISTLATADQMIANLHNTGVDAGGALLQDGATDPYYALSTSDPTPGIDLPNSIVVDEGIYPLSGIWTSDSSTSKWIGPVADQSGPPWSNQDTAYDYSYTTTFSMTGFSLSGANITGQFETDNQMIDVLLNGKSTGIQNLDTGGFTYWTQFEISSGFQPGLNTLTFVTHNYSDGEPGYISGPTGVRVELTGSATSTPAPPPGLVAAFGLGVLARRRRG